MDSEDLFSDDMNNAGYYGDTMYSSLYMTKCRNFKYTWPHNNVFSTSNCDMLVKDIFRQKVGMHRIFAYENSCDDLKGILELFLERHRRTNYKLMLRKSRSNKPSQMQATSRRIVREYVHRLIFNVIPSSLFGSKENTLIFERNVRNILFFGKSQKFSLNMVVQNVRLRNLSYLQSICHYLNKSNLMAKLYVWLVKVYIFGALKCVFYITETNSSQKYSFYEKRVWQAIQERGLQKIKKEFLDVHKNYILSSACQIKNLFILKMIPKRRGCRPICMKWKAGKIWQNEMNFTSAAAKMLLHEIAKPYFKNVHSSRTLFHESWIKFFSTWQKCSRPFVYFVRIDFADAFGSIKHDRLVKLISRLKEEKVDFTRFCFKYRGFFRKVEVDDIFQVLEDTVLNFAFKDNKKIYKFTQGISQGGRLSSILCNLYIGEMSSQYMSEYADDERGFFSRNCDDYLYLTSEKDKATRFLNLVQKGFSDFNLKINDNKTETNLRNPSHNLVSFRNYRIDVESLQLYGCYQSFQNVSIFHKSKLMTVCAPGNLLEKRLLATCCQKLDNIFFDSSYNSVNTMLYNLFLVAIVSAARCFAFMRRLFVHYNYAFIFKCIRRCSKKMTQVVMQHSSFAVAEGVTKEVVQFIVLKGFLVRLQATRLNYLAPVGKRLRNLIKILILTFEESERVVAQPFYNIKMPDTFRNTS